ncbi:MAG: exodeoxyribonuclease VII small subunit [Oscillospiraceae bacterium]|nr:exodeoxyribonuclease VII small subunit [Oscillospiraceae bacterium]
MTFESSIEKISAITERLQNADVPLDEAVKLYKEGLEELAGCTRLLESAKEQMLSVKFAEDTDEDS